jgi:hypothetical protein
MLSPRAWYLASRGISTFASLGLALIYSYELGQVNRAVLAVIMTTNALLWIVTTSGSTLTLRTIGWPNLGRNLYNSFLSLAIIQLSVVLAVFLIVTYFYSSYKNQIPGNLLLIAVVYVCLSGLHLIVMEALISYSKFRLGALLDVSTISIQFMLYLFVLPLGNYSAAISVLLAYLFSYLLVGTGGALYLSREHHHRIKFVNPKLFFVETRYRRSLGPSIGIMDRADRLVIGFSLQTFVLGKYAVTSSLIALLRFVPDTIARFIIAKEDLQKWKFIKNRYLILLLIFGLVISIISVSRCIVEKWLGPDWLIPMNVCLAIAIQELIRGAYVILANKNVKLGFSKNVNSTSIALPILAVLLAQLFLGSLGLIAVPLGFCLAYGLSIMRLRVRR